MGIVELRQQLDRFKGTLYGENGEILCEYLILNDEVIDIQYGDNNKLPITAYTEEDYSLAEQKVEEMMWSWKVVMAAECIVAIGLYLKNRRKFYESNILKS